MDESSWENPSEFRPQRFLGSNVDLRGHHFQLLPFGSGRRACPAINLGLINVYLMLGSLVQCFEWTLPPGVKELDMSETFGLVLHKTNPLVLKASPRLPTEFYVSLVNQ
jgi:cytochrome P450